MGFEYSPDHEKHACDLGEEPSLWDSITNYFTTSEPAPGTTQVTTTTVTPSAPPPNPAEMYSKYFSLADLTVTSLPHPNLPLDAESQENLRKLGELLDLIREQIGTFAIASAYRSPENQAALRSGAGGSTAASMAAKNSYHSLGLAADITPTNGMTPTRFAQEIYLNPLTNALVGQIVDKSEGGNETSLHISLRTSKFTKATPMYVVSGQYYRMTESQISDWLSSKMTDESVVPTGEESFAPNTDELVSDEEFEYYEEESRMKPLLIGVAALLAAYMLAKQSSKKAPKPAQA